MTLFSELIGQPLPEFADAQTRAHACAIYGRDVLSLAVKGAAAWATRMRWPWQKRLQHCSCKTTLLQP